MNTAKHTPGPWAADGAGILYAAPSEADEFAVIEINAPYNSQDRYLIAQVHAGFTQSQANAHLIAAAPAMYEALAKLRLEAIHYRNTGVGVQFLNDAIDQAETAINQAWGINNDTK